MNTIKGLTEYTQIIKKSTFICYLKHINTIEESNEFLTQIRKKHYDASHNCYSYIIDEYNYKYSDDGEPSQTAGIVIYNVLKKNNLKNIICIVTRYFGGIKLGAGGLVRAYGSSCSEALKISNIEEIIDYQTISLTFNYSYTDSISKVMKNYQKLSEVFTDKVNIVYKVPQSDLNNLKENLINITKNEITIE